MKKLEPERCPWCGNILRLSSQYSDKVNKSFVICNWCKKEVKPNKIFLEYFFGVITLVVASYFVCKIWSSWSILLVLVLVALFAIFTNRITYVRSMKYENWGDEEIKEMFLGKADICWYSGREGGIGLPRLRIRNNMIFPVCFVNAEGVPVSQTVCVRLQKRFLYFWRNASVKLITEDLWKADAEGRKPWEKARMFWIFNRGEKIGEGRIRNENATKKNRA